MKHAKIIVIAVVIIAAAALAGKFYMGKTQSPAAPVQAQANKAPSAAPGSSSVPVMMTPPSGNGMPPMGGPGGMSADDLEKLKTMTPEARKAFFEQRTKTMEEEHKKIAAMNPNERREYAEKKREEWINSLSPEKQKEMRDRITKMEESQKKMATMTPEQREEFMKEKREEWLKTLPAEKQAQMRERFKKIDEENKKVQAMSPEERATYMKNRAPAGMAPPPTAAPTPAPVAPAQ